jgi:hypothetical protein
MPHTTGSHTLQLLPTTLTPVPPTSCPPPLAPPLSLVHHTVQDGHFFCTCADGWSHGGINQLCEEIDQCNPTISKVIDFENFLAGGSGDGPACPSGELLVVRVRVEGCYWQGVGVVSGRSGHDGPACPPDGLRVRPWCPHGNRIVSG